MNTRAYRLAIVPGIILLAVSAQAALTITFNNQHADYTVSNIYILFTQQPNPPDQFAATGSSGSLSLTTAYSLAQFDGSGIQLSHVWGGVVFVSLGTPMTSGRTDSPSFLNTSDPDYYTRWDKFEITFNGNSSDVANLTGINSFAIPLGLKTYETNALVQSMGYYVDGETMIGLLQATATNDSAVLKDTGNTFLRVIGPTTYTAPGIGPYLPFDDYVADVKAAAQSTLIAGQYSGPGGTPRKTTQVYTFTASFAGNGDLVMTGGSQTPGGVGTNHTVVIGSSDLVYNIYANNPPYTVDGSGGSFADNDVYSALVRDVLAGFAIGYIGSSVPDPVTGVAFKDEASSNWFSELQPLAFSGVQTNMPYYNQYAEVFWKYSDTYGFPFSDRLHKPVQAALNPARVDTLEIVILPDVIPEPSMCMPVILVLICIQRFSKTGN